MRYKNHILNEAIKDKEKFKEVMIMAAKLMDHSYRDEFSFYTEEAMILYEEVSSLLVQMGYSYDQHINVKGFQMTLLHVMSIVWMLHDEDKKSTLPHVNRNFNSANVIDFLKYKNKVKGIYGDKLINNFA
jgi:hypothetical protein